MEKKDNLYIILKFTFVSYIIVDAIIYLSGGKLPLFESLVFIVLAALSYYNGCCTEEKQLKEIKDSRRDNTICNVRNIIFEIILVGIVFFIQIGVVSIICSFAKSIVFTGMNTSKEGVVIMLLIFTMFHVTGYVNTMCKNQLK